jgi:hypothetical protein
METNKWISAGGWSSEFLERRMEAHKKLMHHIESEYVEEIIDEVHALPARAPRKSGRLFSLLPEPGAQLHIEGSLQ